MVNERILEETPAPDMTNAPLEPWVLGELPSNPPRHEWDHHRLKRSVRYTDIYSQVRRDQRLLALMDERRKKGKERQHGEPVSPQEWLLEQFESFLTQVREKLEIEPPMEAEPLEPPPRIRAMRPARSSGPILNVKPAELLRPEFSKGRLYFSCPACRFPAVLPVWLAGKKVRCPRCYCALRAPHPRKKLSTRVLENDVESILHPERFTPYYKAHRLIPWLGVPRPKLHPAFHTAGVAILVVLLALWIPSLLQRAALQIEQMAALPVAANAEDSTGFKARARVVVEQFLTAENIGAKSAFVREPDRVAALMNDWYQRHDGGGAVIPRAIEVSGAGFYSGEQSHPVTDVRVDLPGGETAYYTVEHLPQGDRIEWESSVGYTADFGEILARGHGAGPQPVRVMATLDDYYNFAFTDPDTHLCLRLHDPGTLEFMGYGYVPADQAGPFVAYLEGSSIEDLRPLTLEVQPADQEASRRQVLVRRLIQNGWRTTAGISGIAAPEKQDPGTAK
jgi:hypothetical protein